MNSATKPRSRHGGDEAGPRRQGFAGSRGDFRARRQAGEAAVAQHLRTLAGATLDVLVEQEALARAPSFAPVKLSAAATPGSILRARVLHTDERYAYAEAA